MDNSGRSKISAMTDREAFEAWLQQLDSNGSGVTNLVYCRGHSIDLADVWHGWQAALASERAKQAEPIPASILVTMYAENPTGDADMIEFAREVERAHGIGAATPAVQAEPVARLHPTDIYDFAGWLTTRPGMMKVGSAFDAAPMADAVGEYLKTFPDRFAAPPADDVAWGIDWGRNGDQTAVSIIKKLPDGSIEVVATEYGPPAYNEAVRLLREARDDLEAWNTCQWHDSETEALVAAIDAYLARVAK